MTMSLRTQIKRGSLVEKVAAGFCALVTLAASSGATVHRGGSVLPNGWVIRPSRGMARNIDTMPQGAAASPDGKILAVVESGFNPATLRLYDATNLSQILVVPLQGAFGRPVWTDARRVLVAGDNADVIYSVDVSTRSVQKVAMPPKSHPIAIARTRDGTIAVADDGDGSVRFGNLHDIAGALPIRIGKHPGALTFSTDARTLFVADRSGSSVVAIDVKTRHVNKMKTGLHPSDVLIAGDDLYVAASDADVVDVYSQATRKPIDEIFVGDEIGGKRLAGASPNALAANNDDIFVSLGAANSIAVLRKNRIVSRLEAGWYPTDVVPIGRRLYVIDGKGERARPNPRFDAKSKSFHDYVGAIEYGSIRTYDLAELAAGTGNPQGATGWRQAASGSVVRSNGPIKHVFFILKENRSYDQVLGDVREGNGDANLVWFGAAVTPNQHALAKRFGLFDNAYASGEVSDSGHNWSDAAFANDFVERFWPPTYGGRRDDDDTGSGAGASAPKHGYIWDAAAAAHVSFRDYGEMGGAGAPTAPTIGKRIDPKYVGWNLDYSDLDREKEWSREFDVLVNDGSLPQLEYIWLPNDHTYGSHAGKPTPVAYVATNDYAVGLMVDKISHSSVWKSSAIFIIEDDAQDGADHVSDQRTTLYIASPFARGGVIHDHFSTVSVLRTIETMLGMQPLSTYDAMAVPMYDAFSSSPNLPPFRALRPKVDITAKNAKLAYGATVSAELDFSKPDAVRPSTLFDILAHNHEATPIASGSTRHL
jgi:DNA-binding beta-propeller fold protein YncE